jgi:hypothetical protein
MVTAKELFKIWDCRRKEQLFINRVGGDFEIKVLDLNGKIIFQSWFQLKKPVDKSYAKIEKLFEEFKELLERQEK